MIDVSKYQGVIHWPKVKAAGHGRAYIKLSEGLSGIDEGIDPRAISNVHHARAAGVQVGLYYFAHPEHAPHRSAADFLRLADGHLLHGDLPPALDLETTAGHDWHYLNDWKAQWFAVVDAHVGRLAVFYSYWYFWKQMRLYPERPVWGAFYGRMPFRPPRSWAFRQWSSTGRVDGIGGAVDLDTALWHTVPTI